MNNEYMCLSKYKRIYIGEEFCDRFFLKNMHLIEKAIDIYNPMYSVSIVLPLINEESLLQTEQFISRIILKYGNEIEFVCNDIGTLRYLMGINGKIVAGRLLTRTIISYLIDKNDTLGLSNYISRVELDSTNFKWIRMLKRYKVSYYNFYSILGISNNRCCFKMLNKASKLICTYNCQDKNYSITNRYLEDRFILVRNAILHESDAAALPSIIDRIINVTI